MCCGITAYRQMRSLILVPTMDLRVLPTGHYNRDFVQSPVAIVNTGSVGNRVEMGIMGRPLDENDRYTAANMKRMGLDPGRTVCFGTAAQMDNAAVAYAALDGRTEVTPADVVHVSRLVMPHRMRRNPFQDSTLNTEELDAWLRTTFGAE